MFPSIDRALALVADRKILEAMEEGLFDNLPGRGRPLDLSQDPFEPPELRLANKLLKNAGMSWRDLSIRRSPCHLR